MKRKHACGLQLDLFADQQPAARPEPAPAPAPDDSRGHAELFGRLARSPFRSRFHLSPKDVAYIRERGMDTIRRHASELIARRLAPAYIPNDGRQTPMRGHPVFLAQHATGCCCRGCLSKWHAIPPGRALTEAEQSYVVGVLMDWIGREMARRPYNNGL